MSFPDLQPRQDLRKGPNGQSVIWAEATGVPVNGNNTFALPFLDQGIPPDQIDEDWLTIRVNAKGPSITDSDFVSLSPDKSEMTISFVQGGADEADVTVQLLHSIIS